METKKSIKKTKKDQVYPILANSEQDVHQKIKK